MKTLKRIALFLSAAAFIAFGTFSCKEQSETDPESIRKQISSYYEDINELTKKINTLERSLEEMGEFSNNRSRTPVTLAQLEHTQFNHYVKVNGSVEAIKAATISTEISGHLREISVEKGSKVKKGQVVARLNSDVINNSINEIKTSLELAETMYKRQKSLWEQEIGSEVQYLQAKNNYESLLSRLKTLKSQLAMSEIKAPFDGIIENIFQKQGELATPGLPIMQLINLNELYVNADISERYLPAIEKGEPVILRFPSYPDFEETVNVHRVSNLINPENRTFRIQLKIDNPSEKFKPNMTAILSIKTYSTDNAIVVPSFLIKQDTQGHFVYKAVEQDGGLTTDKVYVERGLDGEGKTMIISGLNKGDKIIIDGHNQVNSGAIIRIHNRTADLN